MDVEIVRLVATEFDYVAEPLLFLNEFFNNWVQSLLKIIQIIVVFLSICLKIITRHMLNPKNALRYSVPTNHLLLAQQLRRAK